MAKHLIAVSLLLATPASAQFADRAQSTTPPPKFVGGEMPKCGRLSIPPTAQPVAFEPASTETFTTASLQPAGSGRISSIKSGATRVEYKNIRLRTLIALAYPIDECRILWPSAMQYDLYYNGPGSNVGYDRVPEGNMSLDMKFGPFYDFEATFPAGTTESQRQQMLQSFLAARFKLAVHRQMVNLPVYSVYAKHSHLTPVPPPDHETWEAGRWAVWDRAVPASSAAMRMSTFLAAVNQMIFELDRPLVDRTGLGGYYTFRFSMPRDPITTTRDAFDAMKKQLGLIVEEETIPTEMLIIDHVGK